MGFKTGKIFIENNLERIDLTADNPWLEKKKKLMELLKSAEENHKKAGENIKLLRMSLKQKGYL